MSTMSLQVISQPSLKTNNPTSKYQHQKQPMQHFTTKHRWIQQDHPEHLTTSLIQGPTNTRHLKVNIRWGIQLQDLAEVRVWGEEDTTTTEAEVEETAEAEEVAGATTTMAQAIARVHSKTHHPSSQYSWAQPTKSNLQANPEYTP